MATKFFNFFTLTLFFLVTHAQHTHNYEMYIVTGAAPVLDKHVPVTWQLNEAQGLSGALGLAVNRVPPANASALLGSRGSPRGPSSPSQIQF